MRAFVKAAMLCVVALVPAAQPASAQTVTLTITTAGPNTGAVGVAPATGSGGGICNPIQPGTCTYSFASGTPLKVVANSPSGTPPGVFTAIGGSVPPDCSQKTTCAFSITQDSSIQATFDMALSALFRTLTITLAGAGAGQVGEDNNTCQNFDPLQFSACAVDYAVDSIVTMEARPPAGGLFLQFSNATDSGGAPNATACSSSPCAFLMHDNTSITAHFAALTTITVSPSSATVSVGQSQPFNALGTFVNGADTFPNVPLAGQMGAWRFKAALQTPRYSIGAAVLNGSIYAIGGVTSTTIINPSGPNTVQTTPLGSVEVYDPQTDTWSSAPSMSIVRAALGAAAAGGRVYAIGGSTGGNVTVKSVEAFDGFGWSPVADLSGPRRDFSAAVVNGVIYAVGGQDSFNGNVLSTVEAYDTAHPDLGWVAAPSLSTARYAHGVAVVHDVIYAFGGVGAGGNLLSSVEAFDPSNPGAGWTAKASMPSGRSFFAAAANAGQLYAIGGSGGAGSSTVATYDPARDAWFNGPFLPQRCVNGIPLPCTNSGRNELSAVAIGGVVYAIGGGQALYSNQPSVATPLTQMLIDGVAWDTGDPYVAKVTQNGQATGRQAGGPVAIVAGVGSTTCASTGSCGALTVTPPTINLSVPGGLSAQAGSPISNACVSFFDAGGGPWTATVDYGDGSPIASFGVSAGGSCGGPGGPGGPTGAFMLNHTYASSGSFTIAVSLSDTGTGTSASRTIPVSVSGSNNGGGHNCATVTLLLAPGSAVFSSVQVTVIDPSSGQSEGSFTAPLGQSQTAPAGSFRLVFTPPAGFTVTPSQADVSLTCGGAATIALRFAPIDVTPPVLTLPGSRTIEATGPSGAVVGYTTSATDAVDGPVPVQCSPVSGSTFALGTTTVNCTAADQAGNVAHGSFTVRVVDTTPPVASCTAVGRRLDRDDDDRWDDDPSGLFRVSASDAVGPVTIRIGPYTLPNDSVIKLSIDRHVTVVEIGHAKKSGVRRFLVGRNDASIIATDGAGNSTRAACPIGRDRDDRDRDRDGRD